MTKLLPWFAAMVLLSTALQQIGDQSSSPAALLMLVPFTALFGAVIWSTRRTGVLEWSFSDAGVAIAGRPRALAIPWHCIQQVEETPEFFLVRLDTMGCYLPKRALAGREPEIREMLLSRVGERARVGSGS